MQLDIKLIAVSIQKKWLIYIITDIAIAWKFEINYDYILSAVVKEKTPKTDFPTPDMGVSCLSDGVQVEIYLQDHEFDGVLYVKGRSKDEQCRRVVSIPAETIHKTDIIFKVAFGNCGLIHVNVSIFHKILNIYNLYFLNNLIKTFPSGYV